MRNLLIVIVVLVVLALAFLYFKPAVAPAPATETPLAEENSADTVENITEDLESAGSEIDADLDADFQALDQDIQSL